MKKNNILMILILIGIITASILSFNRMKIEAKNDKVDIALDLVEINKLSEQSKQDTAYWLKKFKTLGASTVSLNEETFETMIDENKAIEAKLVDEVIKDLDWEQKYPEELVSFIKEKSDKYDLVVTTKSESLYKFIEEGLSSRYDSKKYEIIKGEDKYIFVLDGTEEEALYLKGTVLLDSNAKPYKELKELTSTKLMRLGLGYSQEKIDMIKESGLEIILRPYNYNKNWVDKKYIKAALEDFKKYDIDPKYMIFTGSTVLGYPENIDMVYDFIMKNESKIGLIESGVQRGYVEQDGIDVLTRYADYNAVRVFSIEPYIQERYKYYNYEGAEEIENTMYRAVTERNIRLIYFRPFKLDSNTYVTDYNEYEKMFNVFENRIAQHGMTLGEAKAIDVNNVSPIYKIIIGIAILSGGLMLVQSILNIKKKFIKLGFILGILLIAIAPYIVPNFSAKIYALLAAIVFPSLSMVYFCSKIKKDYLNNNQKDKFRYVVIQGIKDLLIMSCISLIGSIFVASLLSNTEYLLEMDIFKGVKFAQMIPIIIYMVLFLGYFGYKTNKQHNDNKIDAPVLKELLLDNIRIVYVLLASAVLAVGYIYIARTGHETNVQPSDMEMIGRNFLELKLIARPRTKEFIIAFPAVILAVKMALQRNKLGVFITGLMVVIGQTSIVNTFSHLRTPMYLSAIRTSYGLIFGIIAGILYLILLAIMCKGIKILKGELLDE